MSEGKEILVVNLTRMGDLVQTTPVMAGLREAYPGARITLLVNSVFAEICRDMPFVDRLFVFDKVAFRKMIREGRYSLVRCYRELESFLTTVDDTVYDLAINFTPSGESALLTSLLRAREVRGVTVDGEGHQVIKHPWQRYFMSVVPSRTYNPFHLCDIFLKAGEVSPSRKGLFLSVSEEERRKAGSVLEAHGVAGGDLLIGFQLGASHAVKTWPLGSFAALAERLADSPGARILLTGSGQEEAFGREFESLASAPAVNLIGKTDLRGVAALLERCALFVSNDTGPLHIATAVGTRTLDLSLGHVCFRETGPYGEGHYVVEADVACSPCGFHVECSEPRCREMVTVDSVYEVARRILADGGIGSVEDGPIWRGVAAYRSRFAPDGFLDYIPLVRRPLTKESFFRYLYRETLPRLLDGAEPIAPGGWTQACGAFAEKVASGHGEGALARCLSSLGEEFDALRRMEVLVGEALTRASLLAREAAKPSPDTEWIRRIGADLPAIDREIGTLAQTHPPLMPPVTLFEFGKAALEGKELAALAESAILLYRELKARLASLVEWIERLLAMQGDAHGNPCSA